jgi:hypothetical protein
MPGPGSNYQLRSSAFLLLDLKKNTFLLFLTLSYQLPIKTGSIAKLPCIMLEDIEKSTKDTQRKK